MDNRQNCRLVLNQSCFEFLEGEPFAPRLFNGFDVGPITTGHVDKTKPEVALDCHQDRVAGFDSVGNRGFHSRAASAAHGQGEAVIGLPGVAKEFLNFTHQLHIERVEVANGRPG